MRDVLPGAASAARRDVNAQSQLFALKNPPVDDPDLREFVESSATELALSIVGVSPTSMGWSRSTSTDISNASKLGARLVSFCG